MKEFLFLAIMWVLFLLVSVIIHFRLMKSKLFPFILWCLGYLLFIFLLFDRATTIHQYFRDRNIYLEFGHAEEGIVRLILMFIALAILNIVMVLVRIIIKKHMTN
jgi:hypothetical protein